VVVQDIFSRYIAVRSPIAVTRFLNFHHRLTKRHRAKTNRVREGHSWKKKDVLRILHNPVYAGLTSYRGEKFPGEHQGIVDLPTFDAAQALLKDRGKHYHETGRNPEYLLRGVLRCKHCGAPFTAASTNKRGHIYRYYRCMTRDKLGKDACPSRQFAARALEKAVIDLIGEQLSNLDVAREVTLEIRDRMAEELDSLALEKGELPKLIRRISDEVKRMVSAISEIQGHARSALEAKIEEVGAQVKVHEARLREVESTLTTLECHFVNVEFVDSCLRDFAGIWKALSSANKARLVRTLIERIEIDGATGEYRIVLTDLAKEIAA
jgi:site-specific DNA recombinase